MKVLSKIIKTHTHPRQFILATVSTIIGMVLLLVAIQFFFDINTLTAGTSGKGDDFIIINKKVSILNTLVAKAAFTDEEISELHQQPFVNEVATFSSNRFRLLASSDMMGFQTELFFEALPDKYVDVSKRRFKWKEGQDEVPMVVSRDYLALYNFGFAPSQGLPQLTPTTIRQVTLNLTLIGDNGMIDRYKGRIVGFSDKINSVLVPKDFLTHANNRLGSEQSPPPSRVLLSTDNPYSKELADYLKDKNYEVSTGQLIGGELKNIIHLLTLVIAGLGGLIFLLAMLVVVQNFKLMIAKSSDDIRRLIGLGYRHQDISKVIQKTVLQSGIVITAIVVAILVLFRLFWVNSLTSQGFEIGFGFAFLTCLAFLVVIGAYFVYTIFSIKKGVQRLVV